MAGNQFPLPPPQNQLAITLDGIVQSAPAFQEGEFPSNVVITGDFSRSEAEDLARLLRYGALPVQFDESQQTVENVSPTLGKDQLHAGIVAGIVGIALVSLYMFLYYRLLGLVVLIGLGLTAAATYSLIAYLGDQIGLALTLAGVTGLIVSVGVTVDSYVVYFERLKDEVRSGKTVRSSVDRGFARSFQTILAADLVSLIGAGVLYALAIGSVRGFAFFLGLATVLDLIIAYFFMHPLVVLLARRPGLLRARYVGIASGLDASEATAEASDRGRYPAPQRAGPSGPARRDGMSRRRHHSRAHQLRLRRPGVAMGAPLGDGHRHLPAVARDPGPQPRHRLRGRHVLAVHGGGQGAVGGRRPRHAPAAGPGRRQGADPRGRLGPGPGRGARAREAGRGHRRTRGLRRHPARRGVGQRGGADLGRQGQRESDPGTHHLLRRHRAVPLDPFRMEDGGRGDRRGRARHHRDRGRVLD